MIDIYHTTFAAFSAYCLYTYEKLKKDLIQYKHVICEGCHFNYTWKHLHYRIISLRWDVCVKGVKKKTCLTTPLFIKLLVSSDRSCIYLLRVSILSYVYHFSTDFWNCSDSVVFLFLFYYNKVENIECLHFHRCHKININWSCVVLWVQDNDISSRWK